ncbi:hypothetical protein D4764_01G0017510 [Takifugu flavidus]|uniref:Uncharacterized protein n=1 Tax=Takifugu flavidus TaxID=433684 RepID=A0A5C6PSJ4_9TELE|nr:hypothetical protein D4764_01G0017510 [Takifugu flavidus]
MNSIPSMDRHIQQTNDRLQCIKQELFLKPKASIFPGKLETALASAVRRDKAAFSANVASVDAPEKAASWGHRRSVCASLTLCRALTGGTCSVPGEKEHRRKDDAPKQLRQIPRPERPFVSRP